MPEWHKVKDSLPPIDQYAVWWSEYGLIAPCIAYIAKDETIEWCYKFTFWYPIPAPPQVPQIFEWLQREVGGNDVATRERD